LRYGAIVWDFLAFLGPRAQDDLSIVTTSDIRHFRDYQADRNERSVRKLERETGV
jgi:hypothetical protein